MAEEKKIGAIKEELQAAEDSMLPDFIARYEKDERSGVKTLVEKARKRIQKLETEYARIENLKKYEKEYADAGYICGIDEVGRGPLAGPVVAGAVILPKDCDILYINDSKKLSASMREKLYDEIMEKAVATGIGMAGPGRIDEINILHRLLHIRLLLLFRLLSYQHSPFNLIYLFCPDHSSFSFLSNVRCRPSDAVSGRFIKIRCANEIFLIIYPFSL